MPTKACRGPRGSGILASAGSARSSASWASILTRPSGARVNADMSCSPPRRTGRTGGATVSSKTPTATRSRSGQRCDPRDGSGPLDERDRSARDGAAYRGARDRGAGAGGPIRARPAGTLVRSAAPPAVLVQSHRSSRRRDRADREAARVGRGVDRVAPRGRLAGPYGYVLRVGRVLSRY